MIAGLLIIEAKSIPPKFGIPPAPMPGKPAGRPPRAAPTADVSSASSSSSCAEEEGTRERAVARDDFIVAFWQCVSAVEEAAGGTHGGVDREALLVRLDGVDELARRKEGVAQSRVGLGEGRVELDRLTRVVDRGLVRLLLGEGRRTARRSASSRREKALTGWTSRRGSSRRA